MARNLIRQQNCSNCQNVLESGDNFCSRCGQENHIPNQPIRHYLLELIESLFHLDSKFFKTVGALLTKPGVITKEYCENKRARFMPPVRLYVFASFVFFLVLQIQPKSHVDDAASSDEKEQTNASDNVKMHGKDMTDTLQRNEKTNDDIHVNTSMHLDSLDQVIANQIAQNDSTNQRANIGFMNLDISKGELAILKKAGPEQIDSFIKSRNQSPNYFSRRLMHQLIKWSDQDENLIDRFKEKVIKFSSVSLLFLMPVFAFILFLLYWRSKRNYYEFLIFSIHYHILVFIILSALFIIQKLFNVHVLLVFATILGIYAYLWIAMKNHFGQSWLKSFFKSFLAGISYQLVVFTTVVLIIIVGWYFT